MAVIYTRKGEAILVDDGDYASLVKFNWFLLHGYAVRTTDHMQMHRLLYPGVKLDHKNGCRADNRRQNLRPATPSQNCANRVKWKKNASSKYKGVSWCKRTCRWQATIRINYKQFHLGRFASEEEAFAAYKQKAVEAWGEFACF